MRSPSKQNEAFLFHSGKVLSVRIRAGHSKKKNSIIRNWFAQHHQILGNLVSLSQMKVWFQRVYLYKLSSLIRPRPWVVQQTRRFSDDRYVSSDVETRSNCGQEKQTNNWIRHNKVDTLAWSGIPGDSKKGVTAKLLHFLQVTRVTWLAVVHLNGGRVTRITYTESVKVRTYLKNSTWWEAVVL